MENENNLKSKKVETFTGDVVKAIGGNQAGIVKKLIHEDEDRKAGKRSDFNKSSKNMFFLALGIILLVFTGAVLFFSFVFNKNLNTTPVMLEQGGIIYTDRNTFQAIDGLTKENTEKAVFDRVKNTNIKVDGIEAIYLTENNAVINFKRFINLIKSELDQIHISIIGDYFMMGAMNKASNPTGQEFGEFFILLQTRSFDDIFPVMKIWERKMLHDLSGFIGVNLSPSTNYLFTKDWEDTIILNKNTRVLRDQEGNTVLSYVFLTNQNVLITNGETATKEVMLRLATGQIKK